MTETILFFDDWALHYKDNMKRRMGEPELVPEATIEDELVDTTWQGNTVWYDDEDDLWKVLYLGTVYHHFEDDIISFYRADDWEDAFDTDMIDKTHVVLYAESPDGIHWEKPDLSADVEVPTRVADNQVFAGDFEIDADTEGGPQIEGGPVFVDERADDPEKRFKFLYAHAGENGEVEHRIATSPDGVHWTVDPELGWGGEEFEGQEVDHPMPVFYNSHRDTYVITHRFGFGERRVAITETPDFRSYSEPELVVYPDTEDPDLSQFYGMPVFPYEGMYVAFLWRIYPNPNEIGHKWLGRVDSTLAYSYNGTAFNRATHESFVPTEEFGTFGAGSIYPSSMITTDDEIRIYSGASTVEHFRRQDVDVNNAGLVLHTLRKDGFFSLRPSSGRGEILTRPLVFESADLRLNVEVPHGRVRAQIVDTDGDPVPGLTYRDSVPFSGDEIEHEPRWESDASLESVLSDPVSVGIEVTEGALYAIRGDFDVLPLAPDKVLDRY